MDSRRQNMARNGSRSYEAYWKEGPSRPRPQNRLRIRLPDALSSRECARPPRMSACSAGHRHIELTLRRKRELSLGGEEFRKVATIGATVLPNSKADKRI